MKVLLWVTFLFITSTVISQDALNLSFESYKESAPDLWKGIGTGGYAMTKDSVHAQNGKYAVLTEFISEGSANFGGIMTALPHGYAGKKITLKGYVKTENVTSGYAGLWMRIDPKIGFDNMGNRGIKGTTDWKEYSITLDMDPENTRQIVIGGILVGDGKAWFDHFSVSIDGKDISLARPYERVLTKAEMDKEFDRGSGIASIPTDAGTVQKLEKLGRIWGFLKYYHPAVAAGNYDWDYELFRVLPNVLKASTDPEFDDIIITWINRLGTYKKGKPLKLDEFNVKLAPDLRWITGSNFSPELTSLLNSVKDAERTDNNFYIEIEKEDKVPVFKHEKGYEPMRYPDAGFRLLTLYRYWNIIQYFYPDKHLIEEDWNTILPMFIPKLVQAEDELHYVLTVRELIGHIHDTHANEWSGNKEVRTFFGIRDAPVKVKFVENEAVVTGYWSDKEGIDTGLKPGDIISTVNGKQVMEIVKEKLRYYPASNYPTQLRDISVDLLRTNDDTLEVGYIRDGKVAQITVKTFLPTEIHLYDDVSAEEAGFKMLTNDIAYINNGSLKRKDLPEYWEQIKNTKGLVIDNRNYPSDMPLFELAALLLPKKTQFVTFTNGHVKHPGLFTYGIKYSAGSNNKGYYKGKVIILVNEISQSSSEFHAMAYKTHPNALVVGSTTAGADGNVAEFSLPGGLMTMISSIGVLYPDGNETQRVGIIPDVFVEPTISDIKKGEDTVLNKAIELIEKE